MNTTTDHPDTGHSDTEQDFQDTPGRGAPRRLRRPVSDRMVAGVAAGIADYLDVDVAAVRIAVVIFALLGGLAIPLYLAAWLLIPDEESETSIAEDLFARRDRY